VSAARLAELIVEAQPCVVLTDAGVSTESGIPDFRSPGGIWRQYDPMQYATIDAFRRDPAKVWEFFADRFYGVGKADASESPAPSSLRRQRLGVLEDARPNAAHLALAELERRGLVEAVVTQNVDRLHQAAGSVQVIEVHGSIRTASCPACGHREGFERVRGLLPVPRCERCGSVLKPDVVMFGELLPAGAMETAAELVGGAGLLLVVGSSLEVYPVAGLADEAARLAIVNRGTTPFDTRAELVVDASAGETLTAVVEQIA
jgi:NAD-dependent deacetylase